MQLAISILQVIFTILFIVSFFCHIVYKLIIYPSLAVISLLIGILQICTKDTIWGIITIICAFIWMYAYYTVKNKIKNIISKLS